MTIKQWLNLTSAVMLFTTQRVDLESLDTPVRTETVVQNLQFDTERVTRYKQKVQLGTILQSQHTTYNFGRNESSHSYFEVTPGGSEVMRYTGGRYFEVAFELSPDLIWQHLERAATMDPIDIVCSFGGFAVVLHTLMSVLLSGLYSRRLQSKLLDILFLFQDGSKIVKREKVDEDGKTH